MAAASTIWQVETLEELVYAAAVRRLDKQEHVLGELRATTGILLAASSLTASFLGQRAIVAGRLGVLVVLALVSFAILVAAALYVLAPRQAFAFAVSAARVTRTPSQSRSTLLMSSGGLHTSWTGSRTVTIALSPVSRARFASRRWDSASKRLSCLPR